MQVSADQERDIQKTGVEATEGVESIQGWHIVDGVRSSTYDRRYFLESCEGHRQFAESEGFVLSPRMERALELADINAGMHVLDVGAGRGEVAVHIALKGAYAVALDYSEAAVGISSAIVSNLDKATRKRIKILRAHGCSMPFPESTYDVVLMLDIVEHLYPVELDAAIAEANRVLKPNGRLVVHTAPNAIVHRVTYPVFRVFRRIVNGDILPATLDEFNPVNQTVHVNKQTPWSLRRTLQKHFKSARVWLEDTNPSSVLLRPEEEERRPWARFVLRLARCHYPLNLVCCNHIFAVAGK